MIHFIDADGRIVETAEDAVKFEIFELDENGNTQSVLIGYMGN